MKKFGNVLWGIVLIVIGLIIGGNALGITNINIFFDGWWTLFIIIPCFIGIFKENEKRNGENSYCATFAIFLIVTIISGILGALYALSGVLGLQKEDKTIKENYTIKADKGIGSIKIDGKEMADDVTYGDGENSIKIDGGIGSIKIDFEEE